MRTYLFPTLILLPEKCLEGVNFNMAGSRSEGSSF